MDFVKDFDLFLFDFDGLLVDTEPLHYQAFMLALREYCIELDWDFATYCSVALSESHGLKKELLIKNNGQINESNWPHFYETKKKLFLQLCKHVAILPGVLNFLEQLNKADKKMAVVTNSPRVHTEIIKKQHPILQTIPLWITREDYHLPKPSPDGYQKAMSAHRQGLRIVGFEDSPKGIASLIQTEALPVMVNSNIQLAKPFAKDKNVLFFSSFESILSE
jgi:HAD superfamily hydrolase (TIGR01509 family)